MNRTIVAIIGGLVALFAFVPLDQIKKYLPDLPEVVKPVDDSKDGVVNSVYVQHKKLMGPRWGKLADDLNSGKIKTRKEASDIINANIAEVTSEALKPLVAETKAATVPDNWTAELAKLALKYERESAE